MRPHPLVAAFAAAAVLLNGCGGESERPKPEPSRSAAPPEPTDAAPTEAAPTEAPAPAPAPSPPAPPTPWQPTAADFGRALVNQTGGRTAWLARLKPLVGVELYDGYTYTDLSRLPDGRLKRVVPGRLRSDGEAVEATLYYAGGTEPWQMKITLRIGPGGRHWQVATAEPISGSDPATGESA